MIGERLCCHQKGSRQAFDSEAPVPSEEDCTLGRRQYIIDVGVMKSRCSSSGRVTREPQSSQATMNQCRSEARTRGGGETHRS